MSATSFDFDLEYSEFTKFRFNSLLNNIFGDGLASTGAARGHANTANRITADRARNGPFVTLYPAMDQGDVCLAYPSAGKLRRQFAMGDVIFCDNNQAAGFFIEAVHDSRT